MNTAEATVEAKSVIPTIHEVTTITAEQTHQAHHHQDPVTINRST